MQRRACALFPLFALLALLALPAAAQDRRGDHWVATWATALVARPQPAAGRGQGPAQGAPASAAAPAAAPGAPAAGAPPAAPAGAPPAAAGGGRQGGPGGQPPLTLSGQTLRQVVRVSLGGSRVRVVLSNAFGTAPIEIGAASIASRAQEANIVPASSKAVTFSGRAATSILPGAVVVSDPVDLTEPALGELAIDLFRPG